jgi:hypothetical protein
MRPEGPDSDATYAADVHDEACPSGSSIALLSFGHGRGSKTADCDLGFGLIIIITATCLVIGAYVIYKASGILVCYYYYYYYYY